jgi:peptide/nickel transport system substrate-binding protein
MKRREFAQAFLVSLVCGSALAADPLPTLRETPMFADQVKSGALPPIGERIPTGNPRW